MMSFIRYRHAGKALAAAAVATMMFVVAGCGQQQQKTASQTTLVKSMQVIKRDTPLMYEYSGFVQANQEMDLKSQVSGQIKAKFFKGGDTVQAGQVLYSIDPRTYQANLLSAQGSLANAKAAYALANLDAERYSQLYSQNAISKQVLDNALTQRDQAAAAVKVQEALLANAEKDMGETNVVAPFTGRIDTTSLEVGNYVAAGQTSMGTISDTDPVYVKFSVAENEYLRLAGAREDAGLNNLTAILSDGSTYPLKGKVAEVNRGINDNTGSLTVRALFANPQKKLLPGMFAHIQAIGDTKEGALLVPQRSIVELMYKKFIYVIGADNKVKMQEITLGKNVGRMVIVESGLNGDEVIVAEGSGKLSNGMEVKAEPMTEADLDTTKPLSEQKQGEKK